MGGSDGTATVVAAGGVAPYSYNWYGPNSYSSFGSSTINNLEEGNYIVSVTDVNGCFRIINVDIISNPIVVTSIINEVSCNGGDGAIDITVTGVSLHILMNGRKN